MTYNIQVQQDLKTSINCYMNHLLNLNLLNNDDDHMAYRVNTNKSMSCEQSINSLISVMHVKGFKSLFQVLVKYALGLQKDLDMQRNTCI